MIEAARRFVFGWLGWLLVEVFDKTLTVAERLFGDRVAERIVPLVKPTYRAGCWCYATAYRLGARYN